MKEAWTLKVILAKTLILEFLTFYWICLLFILLVLMGVEPLSCQAFILCPKMLQLVF